MCELERSEKLPELAVDRRLTGDGLSCRSKVSSNSLALWLLPDKFILSLSVINHTDIIRLSQHRLSISESK